jgi:hypothetical protein
MLLRLNNFYVYIISYILKSYLIDIRIFLFSSNTFLIRLASNVILSLTPIKRFLWVSENFNIPKSSNSFILQSKILKTL